MAGQVPPFEHSNANVFARRYPRALFTVPITVRQLSRGGVRTTEGLSLDLGVGGLGAIVRGNVVVGDTVAIDFRLREQPLSTIAVVRHTSNGCSGFEFVGLTPEEQMRIIGVVGKA